MEQEKVTQTLSKARQLMNEHGLHHWRIELDHRRTSLGRCNEKHKVITLSKPHIIKQEEHVMHNTILHEIAHAKVGAKHHHNNVWREYAISIGCDGNTCAHGIKPLHKKYKGTCPKCGRTIQRDRLTHRRMSCGECCRAYNNNRFSLEYLFAWSLNDSQ